MSRFRISARPNFEVVRQTGTVTLQLEISDVEEDLLAGRYGDRPLTGPLVRVIAWEVWTRDHADLVPQIGATHYTKRNQQKVIPIVQMNFI